MIKWNWLDYIKYTTFAKCRWKELQKIIYILYVTNWINSDNFIKLFPTFELLEGYLDPIATS